MSHQRLGQINAAINLLRLERIMLLSEDLMAKYETNPVFYGYVRAQRNQAHRQLMATQRH